MRSDEQEKRVLASKLVHLTLRAPTISGRGITTEYRDQIRNRYFDEQTELRVKHFSLEELRALLDFYQSEIGESILRSQNRMIDDMGLALVSGEEIGNEKKTTNKK